MNVRNAIFFISGLLAVTVIQRTDIRQANQESIESYLPVHSNHVKFSINVPALGFRNILANYAFVDFLAYFGDDEARTTTDYSASSAFFQNIIHYDPYFTDFYLFLSQSTSVHAGEPEKTISIMNDGLRKLAPNHPSDGYHIWRYKGVDELLFLGDSQSAKESFEKSARWAAVSSDPISNAIGKASQRTAQFLAADPDSIQAQISAWASVITSTPDSQTRERAVREIESLGGSVIFGENGSVRIESP